MLFPNLLQRTMNDDFFDDFFSTPSWSTFSSACTNSANAMKTDIQEFDDRYQLELELPGYRKEDVKAQLKDGYLTISASRSSNQDTKDENGSYLRRERYYGASSRSFYVGDKMTEEDIKARFENGILHVEIPKKEETKQVEQEKYIAIEG